MPKLRLLKLLPLVLCLGLPLYPAPGLATSATPTTLPTGVCASVATCDAEIDKFRAAHDSELFAMALWGKIAALQRAGQFEDAKSVRAYLVAVLAQTYGIDHAYTVAARSAIPEMAMQNLLPAWQKRQQANAAQAARRAPILERLRAGKGMVPIAEAYFEISKHELTQAEWDAVMGTNPSHFNGCPDCPVENVDGETVRAFIRKLNQLTGKAYRLPTVEEWRHAYNAGYSGSIDENEWHADNASGRTHPVGQKKPNSRGLYDLGGNVSEWAEDLGSSKSSGDDHLTAIGSSWAKGVPEGAWYGVQLSAPKFASLGFRLARSLEKPPAPKKLLPACHDLVDAPKPAAPVTTSTSGTAPASLPNAFRDCTDCPEMVALPASRYVDDNGKRAKLPAFAIARTEITVAQFRHFIEASGYRTTAEIYRRCNGPNQDWRRPGWPQSDVHPAVCVSVADAKAYVDWLSKLTGQTYTIPNNLQWDFAARAGSTDSAIWGEGSGKDSATACRHANLADRCFEAGLSEAINASADFPCADGYVYPASVGRFPPNAFGLYDMIGNVEEWTNTPFCDTCDGGRQHVRGGGSWSGPDEASFDSITTPGVEAFPDIGFRPVRVMLR